MIPQELATASIYYKRFKVHGDSFLSVAWEKEEDQQELFEIVSKSFKTKTPEILDVGCGLGHFHKYLIKKDFKPEYYGIDLLPQFVEECEKKGLVVKLGSVLDIQENYDYITAIGTFHYSEYEIENPMNLLKHTIKYLYNHSKKGFIFTLLKRNKEKFHTFRAKDLIFTLRKMDISRHTIVANKNDTIYVVSLQK